MLDNTTNNPTNLDQHRAILPCLDISPIVGTDIPGPVHRRTVDGSQRSWPVGILIIMS